MKVPFRKVASFVWSQVRILDVCIVVLVLMMAEMNLYFTSRVTGVVQKLIEFHHQDDAIIGKMLGIMHEMNELMGDLNTRVENGAVARRTGSPGSVSGTDDLKARLTALE